MLAEKKITHNDTAVFLQPSEIQEHVATVLQGKQILAFLYMANSQQLRELRQIQFAVCAVTFDTANEHAWQAFFSSYQQHQQDPQPGKLTLAQARDNIAKASNDEDKKQAINNYEAEFSYLFTQVITERGHVLVQQQQHKQWRYIVWALVLAICIAAGGIAMAAVLAEGWVFMSPWLAITVAVVFAVALAMKAYGLHQVDSPRQRLQPWLLSTLVVGVGLATTFAMLLSASLLTAISIGFFGAAFVEFMVYHDRTREGFDLWRQSVMHLAQEYLYQQALQQGCQLTKQQFILQDQQAIKRFAWKLRVGKVFAVWVGAGFSFVALVDASNIIVELLQAKSLLALLASGSGLGLGVLALSLAICLVAACGYTLYRYTQINEMLKQGYVSPLRHKLAELLSSPEYAQLQAIPFKQMTGAQRSDCLRAMSRWVAKALVLTLLAAVASYAAWGLSSAWIGDAAHFMGYNALQPLAMVSIIAGLVAGLVAGPAAIMFMLFAIEKGCDSLTNISHMGESLWQLLVQTKEQHACSPAFVMKAIACVLVWLVCTVGVLLIHLTSEAAIAQHGAGKLAAACMAINEFLLDFTFVNGDDQVVESVEVSHAKQALLGKAAILVNTHTYQKMHNDQPSSYVASAAEHSYFTDSQAVRSYLFQRPVTPPMVDNGCRTTKLAMVL